MDGGKTMFRYRIVTIVLVGLLIVGMWLLPERATFASTTAVTAADPTVPLNQLELMLKPLTKDELEIEAEAWLGLLKDKVKQISNAEIAVKLKKQEIETTQEAIKTIEQVQQTLEDATETQQEIPQNQALFRTGDKRLELTQQAQESIEAVREALQEAAETEAKIQQEKDLQAAIDAAVQKTSESKARETSVDRVAIAPNQKRIAVRASVANDRQQLDNVTERLEKAVQTKTEVKKQLLVNLNELRTQQTAIAVRFGIVLNALQAKGGEVDLYQLYVDAVSGIQIDVTDTQETWIAAIGWLKSEAGGLRWVQNVSKFLATVAAFAILAAISSKTVDKSLSVVNHLSDSLRHFLVAAVRRIAIATGLIVGLAALEIDISPLLTTLGATGFVLGLAWRQPLGNFANGLILMLYRPFDVGDEVEIAGVSGIVSSMNLAFTEINTSDNKAIAVPNDSIWAGAIANLTGSGTRRVDLSFEISSSHSVANTEQILKEIVAAHPLVLNEPSPEIHAIAAGQASTTFVLRPWVKTPDYWTVYWDITRAVKEIRDLA